MTTRRQFLAATAAVAAGAARAADRALHVATNQYPWLTFYQRARRDWDKDVAGSLAEVAAAGLDGFEPLAGSAAQVHALGPVLKKLNLAMRSLYVNSTLHDPARADASVKDVLDVAAAAQPLGCRIVVTNPSPVRWGGPEAKSDAQLKSQAANLDRLGARLRERGQVLAYHNHDAEMRHSAREFHHMMNGTDPANVSLCLDAHWVFRGAGDSQVALFDVVKLYGARVVELHLRQSAGGVWTEAFGEGDIDYGRLAAELLPRKPHLVLEQAVEAKSPRTTDAVAAHAAGAAVVRRVFERYAG